MTAPARDSQADSMNLLKITVNIPDIKDIETDAAIWILKKTAKKAKGKIQPIKKMAIVLYRKNVTEKTHAPVNDAKIITT